MSFPFTTGILDISEQEYRSIAAANYSVLKHGLKSAAHMRAALDAKPEPSAAMRLGSALDTLLFSPDEWDRRVAVAPDVDRRTKEGKATYAEWEARLITRPNVLVLDLDTVYKARDMVQAVRKCKTATALLKAKSYQRAIGWVDEATGMPCKALLDSVTPGVTITDLKTTSSGAGWREFSRTVAAFSYHLQAAFYLDGWKAVTGEELPYTFIVVESSEPYATAVYRLDEAAIEVGRKSYRYCLDMLKRAQETGEWPGYLDELSTLELPKWCQAPGAPVLDGLEDPF